MRYFACIFSCFLSVISIAQSELTGAAIDITIKEAKVEVQQQLQLNVPDSIQKIELRNLEFAGTDLRLIEVSSDGTVLHFEQTQAKGMNLVRVTSTEQPFTNLELRYTIIAEKKHFYLPLFFTNLPAANSDNDFFKARLKLPKNQNFVLHFPTVEMAQQETQKEQLITLEVPALPSLFRIELLSKDDTGMHFSTKVDWFVAFLFVLIGIIIWKKRNQLRYG